MNPRVHQSAWRWIARRLVLWVIAAAALLVTAALLPGLEIASLGSAFVAVAVVALINAFVWPLILRLLLPFVVLSGGLLMLALNGLIVYVTGRLVPGIRIADGWTAIWTAVGVTIITAALSTLLALDDDASFYRHVVRRVLKRRRLPEATDAAGVIFLEIDGLAHPILLRALRNGYMPNLMRWLDSGSHRVISWECDLSSQTSASQAGILLGNNWGIPAFRWYEKDTARTMASGSPKTAAEVEGRLSNGSGLLVAGGASRGNMFTGDAPDVMCTISAIAGPRRMHPDTYYPFFLAPYNFTRMLALMVREVGIEWREARRQRRADIRPRIHRGGTYPLVRAATNVALRDLNVYTLIADMFAGVPAAYATFVGYDEVAHHSGIERADAMKVLEDLDRQFGRLERAVPYAPRPYHFVVLSDHGQSMGATFLQRYGLTLEEQVHQLLAGGLTVSGAVQSSEAWEHINATLTEGLQQEHSGATSVLRRAVGTHVQDGAVRIGPDEPNDRRTLAADALPAADAIVLGSGNLGLIYFTAWTKRMTLEQINAAFPRLVPGLCAHPGIGFVMARSAQHGPLAIGARGTYYLRDDRVEGENPLARFGPNSAAHLRRTDEFPHVGDLMVNSFYDPERDEIAAFEELVGAHGGLGGDQTRPFVLFPAAWPLAEPAIVGAGTLHQVLKAWIAYAAAHPERQPDGAAATTPSA